MIEEAIIKASDMILSLEKTFLQHLYSLTHIFEKRWNETLWNADSKQTEINELVVKATLIVKKSQY